MDRFLQWRRLSFPTRVSTCLQLDSEPQKPGQAGDAVSAVSAISAVSVTSESKMSKAGARSATGWRGEPHRLHRCQARDPAWTPCCWASYNGRRLPGAVQWSKRQFCEVGGCQVLMRFHHFFWDKTLISNSYLSLILISSDYDNLMTILWPFRTAFRTFLFRWCWTAGMSQARSHSQLEKRSEAMEAEALCRPVHLCPDTRPDQFHNKQYMVSLYV